jgi:hypothetical protein
LRLAAKPYQGNLLDFRFGAAPNGGQAAAVG